MSSSLHFHLASTRMRTVIPPYPLGGCLTPKSDYNDVGPPFFGWEFKTWCLAQGTDLVHSPLYHPQSNGFSGRAAQDSKPLLKKRLTDRYTTNSVISSNRRGTIGY